MPLTTAAEEELAIPSIVHYVYPGLDGEAWPYWAFLHAAAVVDVLRPSVFFLHHVEGCLPAGRWWNATAPLLTLSPQPRVESVYGNAVRLMAHQSDVMRLGALMQHGGIYLDTDVLVVRSFAPLMRSRFVIGVQSDGCTANAVMLSQRSGAFVCRWADAYHSFVDRDWDAHSVRAPWQLSEAHPDLVSWLPKTAWFDPGPDDDPGFELFRRNWTRQAFADRPRCYAHHLWHTITAPELKEVTGPGWFRTHGETLYGRVMISSIRLVV